MHTMAQVSRHGDPRPRARRVSLPAKGDLRLPLNDLDYRRHGGGMLRKLLVFVKSKDYSFHPVISIDRSTQHPVSGDLDQGGKILNIFVCAIQL